MKINEILSESIMLPGQGVAEGLEQDYLSQVPNLIWKPVSRSVWNTIQDEGLDEEQDAPTHTDWVMASLTISPEDAQALQAFDDDTIEDFNRFDIHLKSRYPGLTDLIDYDRGTVTIVKPINTQGVAEDKDPCWKGYKQIGMKSKDGKKVPNCVPVNENEITIEDADHIYGILDESLLEAEYQGRTVQLGKPIRSSDGPKKFHVFVKDGDKVKKVNFGDPDMRIKKSNPARRKSFRARHKCDQKKDKTTAGYWSCRKW